MPFITSLRGTYSSLGRTGKASLNLNSITGGTTSTPGNGYRYHIFTSPGTLDTTAVGAPFKVDYLVVAGGGGGGGELSDQYMGGGGGAGGMLTGADYTLSTSTYSIIAGSGGLYYSKPNARPGTNGDNSSTPWATAIGGGAGSTAAEAGYPQANAGGSGGGGGTYSSPSAGGPGTPGQGYPGGPGGSSSTCAGGGGGAGEAGYPGNTPGPKGYGGGGDGLSWSGNGTTYAGGGGGGTYTAISVTAPQGGAGGGYAGGNRPALPGNPPNWIPGYSTTTVPVAASAVGTGGGGGGTARYPAGSAEGSPGSPGIVIVRYSLAQ